jgi:flavin-dependent dehydrogenase
VRRTVLDAALLRAAVAAGATLLARHELTALLRDARGAVAGAWLRGPDGRSLQVRARWLVGADGVQSRVARELGVRRPIRWLDQIALTAHFRGVAARPDADVHLLRGGFFAATTVDGGLYGANLVVPRRELAARAGSDWDAFVQQRLATAPQLAARLRAAQRVAPWRGIGPFACTTTAQTVPGAALVGDAAGYVDPLTGEGIYYAMFGACALGDALAHALHRPAGARAALARYAAVRRAELGPRLLAARLVQRGLRHPFVVGAAMRALRRWPAVADLLVTLTGDTVHPRELLRPSFWRAFAAAT